MNRRQVLVLFCLSLVVQVGVLWAAPVGVVIGGGTAASCQTEAAANAFSSAVAAGGEISFDCGPGMVQILVNTNTVSQTATVDGGGGITLSGEDLRQIFYVTSSGALTLNDIVLVDGNAGDGGAIYVDQGGSATLRRTFLTGNQASGSGGGVYNRGALLVEESSLGSNIAGLHGGGIFNHGGTVTLFRSYLISNQAPGGNGGAVYTMDGLLTVNRSAVRSSITSGEGAIFAAGPAEIVNSTFSNNRADVGGALFAVDNVSILNSTFNENIATNGGAIWREPSSAMTLQNSIVAGSLAADGVTPALNCDGPTMTTLGRNIIDDFTCVPNPGVLGDLLGTDPELGVWYGTPLRGYIPEPTSPAVDYALDCPATDQRGYPRPLGAGCDVGSMERGGVVFLPVVVGE